MAETSLTGRINPLWIQAQPTIDADQYDPALHSGQYGNDGESKLVSGLLGHNLCLPYWGLPSPGEYAQGMTCHGEGNFVRWEEEVHQPDFLACSAALPRSALEVRRELRCRANLVFFQTTVKNLLHLDRPIAWCEHVTYGRPFLSGSATRFYASLGKGFVTGGDPDNSFAWPSGRGEQPMQLDCFPTEYHTEFVNSFVVAEEQAWAWFAGANAELGVLFGYVFPRGQFPWLNVWQCNRQDRQTRGMEFSNTPIEGSAKQLVAHPEVFGRPTFEWLDAGASMSKEFVSFSFPIDASFRGVASVSFDGERIALREAD